MSVELQWKVLAHQLKVQKIGQVLPLDADVSSKTMVALEKNNVSENSSSLDSDSAGPVDHCFIHHANGSHVLRLNSRVMIEGKEMRTVSFIVHLGLLGLQAYTSGLLLSNSGPAIFCNIINGVNRIAKDSGGNISLEQLSLTNEVLYLTAPIEYCLSYIKMMLTRFIPLPVYFIVALIAVMGIFCTAFLSPMCAEISYDAKRCLKVSMGKARRRLDKMKLRSLPPVGMQLSSFCIMTRETNRDISANIVDGTISLLIGNKLLGD